MVSITYRDFDDLYKNFSRIPFTDNPFKNNLIKSGSTFYIDDVFLNVKSYSCNIDMSVLNYTIKKWYALLDKYIDTKSFLLLKDKLKKSNAKSVTFNFKIHTNGKDGCIIAIVFTRINPRSPWNKARVYYRVAEVYKKWAVDLILLNRLFSELEECNCKIDDILLIIPKMFFRIEFLAELIGGYFNIDEFLGDDFSCSHVRELYNKYYSNNSELSKYNSISRKQKLKMSSRTLENIPISKLNIEKTLRDRNYIYKELWR